jgi:TonB family protein
MRSRLVARTALGLAVLLAAAPASSQEPPPAAEPRAAGTEVPVPKRTRFVQPEYPAAALAQGLRGIVILALTIDVAGKVAAVDVVRSLPPFDDAATAAARQWEYEVTKVDGNPVPVRLTVPITFALRLPEMTRESGIPELRQGVSPPFPAEASGGQTARVTAELTVDPGGQVVEAEIKSGTSPWSDALLAALRTWRFTPPGGDGLLSFQVRADFVPSSRGAPRVELSLSDLRHREAEPAVAEARAEPPAKPAADAEAGRQDEPAPPAVTPATPSTAAPGTPTPAAGAEAPATPPATPPAVAPPPGPPAAAEGPRAAGARPEGAQAAAEPAAGTPAPPAVEIIPPAPEPPRPVEPGVSAVQDVLLGPGVPDLSKGRRPVVPPVARMNSLSGNVEVRFVVEASGASSVRDVDGPELLKEAARQTVGSWVFRRTTPERLPLVAVLAYMGDVASASVKVAE